MKNTLIPELLVSDYQKSLHFYKGILGFEVDYDRPENKFAMLSYEGSNLMIDERSGVWETGELEYPFGRGINIQIATSDVESLLTNLKANGIELYQNVEDSWYRKGVIEVGRREFLVQDPDGYLLRFSQDIGERSIK